MRRLLPALVAATVVTLLGVTGLIAGADVADCTTQPCVFAPLLVKPLPTNTPVTPSPYATLPPPPPTPTRDPEVCAPEYPTVCIPPPPPDLDCPDIPYRNFAVLPPDRHRFDADHDVIGCEQ